MASSAAGNDPLAASDVRLRGGRQQRKRKLAELVASSSGSLGAIVHHDEGVVNQKFDSDLVAELIKQWCWGFISAVEIQTIAYKAFQDMKSVLIKLNLSHDHIQSSLRFLASLGTWGRYPGHISQELKIWLGEPSIPPPRSFSHQSEDCQT